MKTCQICNKPITAKSSLSKYCSIMCRRKASNLRVKSKRKVYIKNCPICKITFNTRYPKQVYCSKPCHETAYKDYDKRYALTHKEYFEKYKKSPERRKKQRETDTLLRKKDRNLVLIHYGGSPPKCACCGESNIHFLTIDHINGGARREQKLKIRPNSSHALWRWIIKNDFPPEFRVLCYNCNCGRARFRDGICPHKRKE